MIVDVCFGKGQSNWAGRGVAAESPVVPVDVGLEYEHGQGLHNPLVDPTVDAVTGSLHPALCIEYHALTGRPLVIASKAAGGTAQCAAAGSGTNHWDVGGVLWDQSVTVFNACLSALATAGHTVNRIFGGWGQGERDAQKIDDATINVGQYKAALEAMIERDRDEFGADFPFFIWQTGHLRTGDTTGFQQVRQAQQEIADADPLTYIAFSGAADFPERGLMQAAPDTLHYVQAAYDEMGELGAQAVVEALDGGGPVTIPSLVKVGGVPAQVTIP